jgi:hypothetical protein
MNLVQYTELCESVFFTSKLTIKSLIKIAEVFYKNEKNDTAP